MKNNYELLFELLGYANADEDFLIDYDEEIKEILNKMVLDQENIDVYKKLYEKYKDKQFVVAIEELSELQKELCKILRNEDYDTRNIAEEIADVSIMLEQIMVALNIPSSTIADIRATKLFRTRKRLLCERHR